MTENGIFFSKFDGDIYYLTIFTLLRFKLFII